VPEIKLNRLAHKQSPYLLQHADNSVDWHPWGEEAFALARAFSGEVKQHPPGHVHLLSALEKLQRLGGGAGLRVPQLPVPHARQRDRRNARPARGRGARGEGPIVLIRLIRVVAPPSFAPGRGIALP